MNIKIFYENNNLINTSKEIQEINDYYKTNFMNYNNFEEFIFPIQNIIIKNPLIKKELQKQFIQNKGLQSGILTEINVFATIAKILNITSFITENNQYIGENSFWKIILQGNLNHGGNNNLQHDLLIYNKNSNKTYSGEIKEPLARATDGDVKYDEQGKIYKTARQNIDLDSIKEFINFYNTHITVFSHLGHNYKIKPSDCEQLFLNYFNNIDYLFTFINNKLITIPNNSKLLIKLYSLKGSEIRSTGGKNPVTIFTPQYFQKTIAPFIISENKNEYTLKYGNSENEIHPVKGRGRSDITRFTIPYGFMFKVNDIIKQTKNTVTIPKNKIKQLNANISIHIQLSSDYEYIKKSVLEEYM